MITAFFSGLLASLGLSIIFNIHRKHILFAVLGAGFGSLLQYVVTPLFGNVYLPVFVAALFAGTYGEVMAIIQKAPATTYVIPAILPMVPGAGMYYTMQAFAAKDFGQTAFYGYQTIFIALAIACGVVIAPSIRRFILQQKRA